MKLASLRDEEEMKILKYQKVAVRQRAPGSEISDRHPVSGSWRDRTHCCARSAAR